MQTTKTTPPPAGRETKIGVIRAEQAQNAARANVPFAPSAHPGYPAPAPYPPAYASGFPAYGAPGFAPSFPVPGYPAYGPGFPYTAHAWPNASSAPLAFPYPAAPGSAPFASYGAVAAPPTAFGVPGGSPWTPAPQASPWNAMAPGPHAAFASAPLDIADEGAEFVCQLELPGVKPEAVEVVCTETSLVVDGVREADLDLAALVHSERQPFTPHRRIVALPAGIDPTAVRATLRDGILTVTLPKQVPTKAPQRVEIQR